MESPVEMDEAVIDKVAMVFFFNCQLTNSRLKEMRENMFWILNRNENEVACTFSFELRAESLPSTFRDLFRDFPPKVSCLC